MIPQNYKKVLVSYLDYPSQIARRAQILLEEEAATLLDQRILKAKDGTSTLSQNLMPN